jgi:hypothetical protein
MLRIGQWVWRLLAIAPETSDLGSYLQEVLAADCSAEVYQCLRSRSECDSFRDFYMPLCACLPSGYRVQHVGRPGMARYAEALEQTMTCRTYRLG